MRSVDTKTFLTCAAVTCFLAVDAWAQETELFSCLDDSAFCRESTGEVVDQSCGLTFRFFRGRISWVLQATGPISVSVRTKVAVSSYLPVYIQIARVLDQTCALAGPPYLILVAEGSVECGGIWETVGPIDITRFTPIGSPYRIIVDAFDGHPVPNARSVGLACIRVTTTAQANTLDGNSWASVKALYK